MKLSDVKCPFNSDTGTLAFTGVLGAAHAAALIISPKRINDKLLENSKDDKSLNAITRMGGAMAGAAAITAMALGQKGATMIGVAAIQGVETHNERTKKRIGWATTAIHGGVGAVCLWRGLKEGAGK
ncbi:hypothetical protein MNEG_5708 [Monoraphidium neglectum]|uniref:Uncharacterized protein n=1 Tax=Monoraphidium neglectum TaxID=145388 RepID=A0A0D2MP16_9CHLO|nr:hypothetical protein MNEG_5708 [Monoraphidium neglectum]KIZ02247.1 hypothetical protein MNEG_5708 [Monoraphidium neglectum]|eukprot:XP_013901266.1 hypothetical protein MNEG_5708 [Monoraphidium neglectum]